MRPATVAQAKRDSSLLSNNDGCLIRVIEVEAVSAVNERIVTIKQTVCAIR